jgi:hypothetical protein
MFESVFGAETTLVEITGSRISGWRSERLSAVCPQTKEPCKAAAVNRPLALLRHLLRVARDEWEVLSTVPKIKLERGGQGRLRWLKALVSPASPAGRFPPKSPKIGRKLGRMR